VNAARLRSAGLVLGLALAWLAPASGQPAPGRLTFAPVAAIVGTPVTARATDLPPATHFALVWRSGRAQWRVENGNFFGILAPETATALASGTSDAQGTLVLHFTVPDDFGYLHDVELHSDAGATVAHQGFTVIPHLTLSPASGPVGTPITITATGLGYRFYQVVWHLLYDGAQTGWLSAITTHGTARVTIPASGEIGLHTLQALEGPTAPYLNEEQSPNYQPLIPTVLTQRFRIVAGAPHLPARAIAQSLPRLPGAVSGATGPSLAIDFGSGVVGSAITLSGRGFAPQQNVVLEWETVVGNRLSGNGWETQRVPLGRTVSDVVGGFVAHVRTPNDLGGPHRIIAHVAADALPEAAASYTITPSAAEIVPAVVAPGGTITLHVKGVGYTETGNTYTMLVDDAFFGYGCGFNSQGDVTIHVRAPGRTGWHFVDLFPTIYRGQILGPGVPGAGTDVNGSYLLLPMLNVVDHPGERLPAFHLAFQVR
jgi:hypothetical protein